MRSNLGDLLSAGATLASLNLVFLGFIVTSFQGDPNARKGSAPGKYRRLGVFSLTAFVIGIVSVLLAMIGLIDRPIPHGIYDATITVFFVQLAALIALSIYAVIDML